MERLAVVWQTRNRANSSNPVRSTIQSGMFPYILEKRGNRRAGRDSRTAVDAENANGCG